MVVGAIVLFFFGAAVGGIAVGVVVVLRAQAEKRALARPRPARSTEEQLEDARAEVELLRSVAAAPGAKKPVETAPRESAWVKIWGSTAIAAAIAAAPPLTAAVYADRQKDRDIALAVEQKNKDIDLAREQKDKELALEREKNAETLRASVLDRLKTASERRRTLGLVIATSTDHRMVGWAQKELVEVDHELAVLARASAPAPAPLTPIRRVFPQPHPSAAPQPPPMASASATTSAGVSAAVDVICEPGTSKALREVDDLLMPSASRKMIDAALCAENPPRQPLETVLNRTVKWAVQTLLGSQDGLPRIVRCTCTIYRAKP